MYSLGPLSKDEVIELDDIPQSSVGAPCPAVIADEHHLSVIYLQETPEYLAGTSEGIVWPANNEESIVAVTFTSARAYYHGSPNDEAFSGHPLYSRGLHPYGAYEILNSTWRSNLMTMNRVHPRHRDENYSDFRHFVLAFHDSTFECIARSYAIDTGYGSMREAAQKILEEMKL